MNTIRTSRHLLQLLGALLLGALIGGCATAPDTGRSATTPTDPMLAQPLPSLAPMGPVSSADTQRDYRLDAAYHLYDRNRTRIFDGVMPHFLYAIGVLELQVDNRGNLLALNWMRAPEHAPEVMAEIERTVRQAAPFPAPVRLGQTSYIETWLWDASGNFQLHTLSEGQGEKGTARRPIPPNPRTVRLVSAPTSQQ